MSKVQLSKEEHDLLVLAESDVFKSILTPERKGHLQTSAQHTAKKDKRINIRISNRDLTAIQSRASIEGIPYQTLVASILHKYVSGTLKDVRDR